MQAGEREMCLGLDAGGSEHGHAPLAGHPRGLRQQPRLPNPRLAAKHERLATRPDPIQERPQQPLFLAATQQRLTVALGRGEHRTDIIPQSRPGEQRGDVAAGRPTDDRGSDSLTCTPNEKPRDLQGFSPCAEEDSNLHGPIGPQGPQPCASTNSATGAWGRPV